MTRKSKRQAAERDLLTKQPAPPAPDDLEVERAEAAPARADAVVDGKIVSYNIDPDGKVEPIEPTPEEARAALARLSAQAEEQAADRDYPRERVGGHGDPCAPAAAPPPAPTASEVLPPNDIIRSAYRDPLQIYMHGYADLTDKRVVLVLDSDFTEVEGRVIEPNLIEFDGDLVFGAFQIYIEMPETKLRVRTCRGVK